MENNVALWLIPVFLWKKNKKKICIILHFLGLLMNEAHHNENELLVRNI